VLSGQLAHHYNPEADKHMMAVADLMSALDIEGMCQQTPLCPIEMRDAITKMIPDIMRPFGWDAQRLLGRGDERILMMVTSLLLPAMVMVPAQKASGSKATQLSRHATAFKRRKAAIEEHGYLAVYVLLAHDYQLMAMSMPRVVPEAGQGAVPEQRNPRMAKLAGLMQRQSSFKRAKQQCSATAPGQFAHDEFERQNAQPEGFEPLEFFVGMPRPDLNSFLKEFPAHEMPLGGGDSRPGGDLGDYKHAMIRMIRSVNTDGSACSNGVFPGVLRAWLSRSPSHAISDDEGT